jgi:hypothetical protein
MGLLSVEVSDGSHEQLHGQSTSAEFLRARRAHAGVIVILSLICQVLADSAALPGWLLWIVRAGIPTAAIFLPLGLFLSVTSPN